MRYGFVGAVEGSRHALEALLASDAEVVRVFTLREELAVRHSDFCDLEPLAREAGVGVSRVGSINDEAVLEEIEALELDYLFVIGWSQILTAPLLDAPTQGCIGFHPTLLPRMRGRAAIPWTILMGVEESGTTLFFLDEGVDSGDILVQKRFPVAPDETAASLYRKVTGALAASVGEAVPLLESGAPPRTPQDHGEATYLARRRPSDGWIDWKAPARDVWTLIRATGDPYPGAFTYRGDEKLVVWEADLLDDTRWVGVPGQVQARREDGVVVACGDGRCVLLRVVQPEDGERTPAAEHVNRRHEMLGVDWLAAWDELRLRRMEEA